MNSIVLDLQKEAMDSNVAITDLLRKAFFVAKKLKIEEFEEWINSELDGYNIHNSKVPPYREVKGVLKCINPFNGRYENFTTGNFDLDLIITKKKMGNSIVELEELYIKNEYIAIDVLSNMQFLRQELGMQRIPEVLVITNNKLKTIFDSVRKIVLEWALKLEEDGILGENLTFSRKEEEIAHEHTINYNTLIYGVQESQVQVGQGNIQNINDINIEETKTLLKSIKNSLDKLELNDVNENELRIEIETIESQLKSQNPNSNILKEAFNSIRNILEGCVSNAIAPTLIIGISKLIGL